MHRSPFTDEQSNAILTEYERGMVTAEVCRRPCVSPATFYKWKAYSDGMDVLEAGKLKTLLADSTLDNSILNQLPGKP
ncbi:MAG: transposase [Candidatus Phaeomarinobacter sp.]